jgi:hypothetical protein
MKYKITVCNIKDSTPKTSVNSVLSQVVLENELN